MPATTTATAQRHRTERRSARRSVCRRHLRTINSAVLTKGNPALRIYSNTAYPSIVCASPGRFTNRPKPSTSHVQVNRFRNPSSANECQVDCMGHTKTKQQGDLACMSASTSFAYILGAAEDSLHVISRNTDQPQRKLQQQHHPRSGDPVSLEYDHIRVCTQAGRRTAYRSLKHSDSCSTADTSRSPNVTTGAPLHTTTP